MIMKYKIIIYYPGKYVGAGGAPLTLNDASYRLSKEVMDNLTEEGLLLKNDPDSPYYYASLDEQQALFIKLKHPYLHLYSSDDDEV